MRKGGLVADLQETMGTVIRRERRAQGLTLKDLAARSALSVVYIGEVAARYGPAHGPDARARGGRDHGRARRLLHRSARRADQFRRGAIVDTTLTDTLHGDCSDKHDKMSGG